MPEIPDVNPGEIISTDTFGNPVLNRIIQRYADATARDAGVPLPQTGQLVWLDDPGTYEGYDGTEWLRLDELIGGPFLPLAGGTMTGTIDSTAVPLLTGPNGALYFETADGRIWLSGVAGESLYLGPRSGGEQFGLLEAQTDTFRIPNGALSVETPGPPAGRYLEASDAWTVLRDPFGRMLSSSNAGTAFVIEGAADGDPGGGPEVQALSYYYRNGAGNISQQIMRMLRRSAAFHFQIGSLPQTQTQERAVWVIDSSLTPTTGTLYRQNLANAVQMDTTAAVAVSSSDAEISAILGVPVKRLPWKPDNLDPATYDPTPEPAVLPEDLGALAPSLVETNGIGESYIAERQVRAAMIATIQSLEERIAALEGP